MSILKRLLNARRLLSELREAHLLKGRSPATIFTEFYLSNRWGGSVSLSGAGSDLDQTRVVRRELPVILRELGVRTILDVPCGDFYWMSKIDLTGIEYIGADIVELLIEENTKKYAGDSVRFQTLDILSSHIPKVDLIFCRDCLVHLSYRDIAIALSRICESESTYLLTTTFPNRTKNRDIATGQWRPINLEIVPFRFPAPLKLIVEECTEQNGAYADKAMGLWLVSDIRSSRTSAHAQ